MISCLILGAGGAVPTPTHTPAAYWLVVDEHAVLLDPGPGALVRLLASPRGPNSIDAIDSVLFSHLHLDHCADLAPLLFALHSPVLENSGSLHLIGPVGLQHYLKGLRSLYGNWLTPAKRKLLVTEIQPGQTLAPAIAGAAGWSVVSAATGPAIEVFAANHPQDNFCAESLCLRFRDRQGHRLVFSGDTESSPGLIEASREADLLVVECSTPDEWAMRGHMTPERVGKLCAEAAPLRVVLTHLYPAAAALDLPALIKEYYGGPVIPATDGAYFTVPADGIPREEAR